MTMRDSYDKVPDLSEQDAYGFFKGLKRQAELQISFFTWYDDCNLMRVNIEIGKRVSSMAGFFHMIVNTIFRIWSQTDNPEWRAYVVATIDQANMSGLYEDWEKVGYPIGDLIAQFFNFEIPNYDYLYGGYSFNEITTRNTE